MSDCPFCNIDSHRIVCEGDTVRAIWDAYPLSTGHALIIPKRHVASLRELTDEERLQAMALVGEVQAAIETQYSPDGYNLGINDGVVAGQTINHVHIHVIPRYAGDVEDPRGGIRWVKPDKADYWSKP